MPLWCLVVFPLTWLLSLRLLLTHDPLTRAIALGTDLAKDQALKAIPQEWMGWLAQPVIQMINQYVGPYAAVGEAFMTTWAVLLTLVQLVVKLSLLTKAVFLLG